MSMSVSVSTVILHGTYIQTACNKLHTVSKRWKRSYCNFYETVIHYC